MPFLCKAPKLATRDIPMSHNRHGHCPLAVYYQVRKKVIK